MKYKTATFKTVMLLLVISVITGCAGKIFEDKPGKLLIQVHTSQDLNPDINGRPSPIVLYIFHLKSDNSFTNAPFFKLYENSQETLGSDLIDQQEIEVSPSQNITLDTKKLTLDTRFIGILAAYRDLDNSVWQSITPTPLNKKIHIDINLERLRMTTAVENR